LCFSFRLYLVAIVVYFSFFLKINGIRLRGIVSFQPCTRSNKACTRRWGFWRDFKHFSTPQHFPRRTAFRLPPQRG
jgi:hypothetical protein